METLFGFLAKYIDLTESEKNLIVRTNRKVKYAKNEIIRGPGSVADDDSAYFVLDGCVCCYYITEEREIVSEFFMDGEPVLMPPSGGSATHYLRCLEETTVAVSSAIEGEKLVRELPRFESVCRRFAEERLQASMKFNDRLKVLNPTEKYAFIRAERPALLQRIPQHLVASYLGVAPETLSRVRKQIVSRS